MVAFSSRPLRAEEVAEAVRHCSWSWSREFPLDRFERLERFEVLDPALEVAFSGLRDTCGSVCNGVETVSGVGFRIPLPCAGSLGGLAGIAAAVFRPLRAILY